MNNNSVRKKTIIIGLDGADWKIIESLWKDGKLPNLKMLADGGSYGILRSTTPPNSPPAWASMITGVNPGKHGIFDFVMINDAYQKIPIQPMSKLGTPPFWLLLNEKGISTGVINLPILYPPSPVLGFLVCGMVTPGNAEVFTYPKELSQEIGNPSHNWIIGESLYSDHGNYPEDFLVEVTNKTRFQATFALSLMERFNTDFLMFVFDGSDRLQHFLWRYWDSAHPNYEENTQLNLKDSIPQIYIEFDQQLARLLEKFGESNVFVVSDHGFSALSEAIFLEQFLLEQGDLTLKSRLTTTMNTISGNAVRKVWDSTFSFSSLKNRLKKIPAINNLVKTLRQSFYERGMRPEDYIDWEKTKAFQSGISIRVNMKNREKFGIINSGDEYDQYVESLKQRLLELRDPRNHTPLIHRIYNRDEIYHGQYTSEAPDLVIVAESGYRPQEGCPGYLTGPLLEHSRALSGDHRSEGIFIANGPDIRITKGKIEAQITDIMPTVLYLNGVPVPNYIDGKVLVDLIQEDYLRENPIEMTDQFSNAQPEIGKMTDEEKALLENHLRALGYL